MPFQQTGTPVDTGNPVAQNPPSFRSRWLPSLGFLKWTGWGVLALLVVCPFWFVTVHPLPDLSSHLAAVSIWHNYADPSYEFSKYYALSMPAAPYWVYYTLVHLLTFPFGLDIANRLVLSFYAIGLVSGACLLARCFGRDFRLGLLSMPLIWNANLDIGFVPFLIGVVCALWSLVCFDRFCHRPRMWLGLVVAIAGNVVYFSHLLPWGYYFACAGLIGILHPQRRFAALGTRFAVWLAGVLPGAIITARGSGLHLSSTVHSGARFQISRTPPLEAIRRFYEFLIGLNPSNVELGLMGVWFFVCLVLVVHSYLVCPIWKRSRLQLRSEACLLVAITAYLVLPRSVIAPAYWWGIHIRYAMLAAMMLPLCALGTLTSWRKGLTLCGAVISGLGMTLLTLNQWKQAEAFASGYHELAQKLPKAARVLFVFGHPRRHEGARQHYLPAYWVYHQAHHGGYAAYSFDEGFPVRFKVRYPAPAGPGLNFDWQRHARYYDYLFVFNQPEVAMGHEHEVTRIGESGRWTLWKR